MYPEAHEQVSLASYTTLKTGGVATYVITVTTRAELEAAVVFAQANNLPFLVFGSGSNILVGDAGYAGVVIHMNIRGRDYAAHESSPVVDVTYGAGEILDEVIAETVERGLWGLENLSHIPGTVGATPIQNVGAYGVEVGDCITAVTVFDATTRTFREMSAAACQFAYRDSIFKQTSYAQVIVVSVTFRLSLTPQPKTTYADIHARIGSGDVSQHAIRDAIIAIRSQKFPDWHTVGTAGSFFKNPIISEHQKDVLISEYPLVPVYPVAPGLVKVSLGYILDKVCNLKGFSRGNVRLYEAQALVLVATRGATTAEILAFARDVSAIVKQKTNITIELEVTCVSVN